ncbi:VENN motif pre-toxin domain-containing protein, partial [Xanthomonas prunicola]|uniref:VENN motif pre-toxin domain-containing protein n=4 Tax=Xanthomonas prunicola TaxID=2053930 RepID=UPI000CA6A2F9
FNPNLLPEQDKQMLVALSQAVGAIAGGLAGGSLLDASIGAQIAGNAVTNNAMLSVDEVARIKEMANGDPEAEKRLLAAACSKKKCANGLNSNDPYYAIWSALQTEGDKPEYQNEKDWLSWQSQTVKYPSGSMADALSGASQEANLPLFTYTPFDALSDWSSRNNVGTRTLGGVQMFGGAAEVAGAFVAAPICTTGLGCFAVGYVGFSGADNAISGSKTLFGGVSTPTLGGRSLQMLGLSQDTAELVYGLTQLGAGIKVGKIGTDFTGDRPQSNSIGVNKETPPNNSSSGGSANGGNAANEELANELSRPPNPTQNYAGFKVGIDANEITSINSSFGGSISYRDVDTALKNANNYDGFYNKTASIIRDIAGGHLFDNGNKRTAVEVVERLIARNQVDGPPNEVVRSVVRRVASGELKNVDDISKALKGMK